MKTTSYQMVSAIVMDEDTLQFGGSAFVRERTCTWVYGQCALGWNGHVECSLCGYELGANESEEWWSYCPGCGAKAVGE